MKRREFFAQLNPFRAERFQGLEGEPRQTASASQDPDADLFLLAMAKGIDPATVDAALLPELVGISSEEPLKRG